MIPTNCSTRPSKRTIPVNIQLKEDSHQSLMAIPILLSTPFSPKFACIHSAPTTPLTLCWELQDLHALAPGRRGDAIGLASSGGRPRRALDVW